MLLGSLGFAGHLAGYMVSANNPARVFHCPNDLACPGGWHESVSGLEL